MYVCNFSNFIQVYWKHFVKKKSHKPIRSTTFHIIRWYTYIPLRKKKKTPKLRIHTILSVFRTQHMSSEWAKHAKLSAPTSTDVSVPYRWIFNDTARRRNFSERIFFFSLHLHLLFRGWDFSRNNQPLENRDGEKKNHVEVIKQF